MTRMEAVTGAELARWDEAIAALPGAHLLQTREWGEIKARYGWQPRYYLWRGEGGQAEAAAMALERSAPGGLKVLYAPRGPALDPQNDRLRGEALDGLQRLARQSGVIFIKIDPEWVAATGIPGTADDQAVGSGVQAEADLSARGWKFSMGQVQFRNTVMLDLSGSEDDWLARMKQKTRYNLRLAERKGVTVRAGSPDDLPELYRMYAETSVRDGFVIRPESYYLTVWRTFIEKGMAEALIAEAEGEAVAAILWFHFAGRAWYLYGMSRGAQREKMPNYLLQFEAMRRAKQAGCAWYDLWGAPDEFKESDSMWGVFRFKEGLGGKVVRTIGAWDYTARPLLYRMYTQILPRMLDVMRRKGKARTRAEVAGP